MRGQSRLADVDVLYVLDILGYVFHLFHCCFVYHVLQHVCVCALRVLSFDSYQCFMICEVAREKRRYKA